MVPGDAGVGVFNALVEWIGSLLPGNRLHGKAPNHSRPKGTFTVDPNGGH
jgi:hypothetical protein